MTADYGAEIPVTVADEIASWRRVFASRKNGVDTRQLLRNAVSDLWKTLEVDKTVHPESHVVARQEVVDALEALAETSGIGPDDAQQIFSENFKAGVSNGVGGKAKTSNDEYIKANGRDEWEQKANNSKAERKIPLAWLDMSSWDSEPVPERKWAIKDRVPLNQAGLFSGEGGTGKSIIELMKDVAHVAGKDWFGSLPEQGPAFYIGAEDEKDELHRRLAAIAHHYELTFNDLTKNGLHVLCKLGQDATLCAVGKSGKVEATEFYRQLYEAAGDIKPKNISIDTLSRAFAGNEIDRVQVYAFAMHMQALAMVAGGSVTVLSHPSLQGIASGSGISGSTAWHGAFRFRQFLKGVKPSDGEQPDSDVRELAFKKNQYGPTGEAIILRYQHGLFLPEHGVTNLDKLAREAKVDEVFLRGLSQIIQQGRDAIAGETSREFGPTRIAASPEAKAEKISRKELIAAMDRLLSAGKIHIGKTDGAPSKAKQCILPGAKP